LSSFGGRRRRHGGRPDHLQALCAVVPGRPSSSSPAPVLACSGHCRPGGVGAYRRRGGGGSTRRGCRRAGAVLAATAVFVGRSRQPRARPPPNTPGGCTRRPYPRRRTHRLPPGRLWPCARGGLARRRRRRAPSHSVLVSGDGPDTPPKPPPAAADRRQRAPAPGRVPAALTDSHRHPQGYRVLGCYRVLKKK